MNQAFEIRKLLDSLDTIKEQSGQKMLLESEVNESLLGDLWTKTKAKFGNDEAIGKVVVMNTAKRMIKAFRQFIGSRSALISQAEKNGKGDDAYKAYLATWLVNELGYSPQQVASAGKLIGIPLNNYIQNGKAILNNIRSGGNQTDNKSEEPKQNKETKKSASSEEDVFAAESLSLKKYMSDSLFEDANIKDDVLQKLFTAIIINSEDDQPEFVDQAMDQEKEKATGHNSDKIDLNDQDQEEEPEDRKNQNQNQQQNSFQIDKTKLLGQLNKAHVDKEKFNKIRKLANETNLANLSKDKDIQALLSGIGYAFIRSFKDGE